MLISDAGRATVCWRGDDVSEYTDKDGPVQCVSMVLGARAYDAIFNSTSENVLTLLHICGIDKRKAIWMNDSCLAAIIIGFVVTCAVHLTAWTASDPFVRVIRNGTVPSGDTLVIVIKDFCHNNANHNYWIATVITFEMALITACTVFAFLNRKVTLKEFQTHSVILLAYILALSSFVGVVAYFITANIGEDQSVLCVSCSA